MKVFIYYILENYIISPFLYSSSWIPINMQIFMWLKLSQTTLGPVVLNWSHFISFFLFLDQHQWLLVLSSSLLIHVFASFSLLLITSSVFFILAIVFFLSIWFFFLFSNSLFKTSNFSFCTSILLLTSLIFFTVITLNPYLGRYRISTSLSPSPGVYRLPSSGTYSSASSFCLHCYLYFYVCMC